MADQKYRIGIDLGGTNIKVGIIGVDNAIIAKKSGKTKPIGRPWQDVVADMARLTKDLLAEENITLDQCEKLGIGSPGMIDHLNGVVVFAGNFDWQDVPLITEMRRYFNLPLRLSNDANVAVLGEAVAGAAKGAKDVVMLTLGTGVGGGVVANGVLQEGGAAGGMELGHTIIMMDGAQCTCGQKGCIEAYASATGLIREAREAAQRDKSSALWALCGGDLDNMNGAIPFKAMRQGDVAAQGVVDRYVSYVGTAVINFVNIWRPEKVLLGGGVANEGDPLIVPVNEFVRPRVFAGDKGYIAPVMQAALGNDAGLIGAAAL